MRRKEGAAKSPATGEKEEKKTKVEKGKKKTKAAKKRRTTMDVDAEEHLPEEVEVPRGEEEDPVPGEYHMSEEEFWNDERRQVLAMLPEALQPPPWGTKGKYSYTLEQANGAKLVVLIRQKALWAIAKTVEGKAVLLKKGDKRSFPFHDKESAAKAWAAAQSALRWNDVD